MHHNGRVWQEARVYLGTAEEHTIHEAEAIGVAMAFGMLADEVGLTTAMIGLDGQAAIKATQHQKGAPGGYIFDTIHELAEAALARNPRAKFSIRWVPGHQGFEENKRVDISAKAAARGEPLESLMIGGMQSA